MTLPEDSKGRAEWPLWDYQTGYFPDAWLAEVQVAWIGNQQHNPGEPMHWAREKSTDHMNKAARHQWDYGRGVKKDVDGCWHLAKAIWRLKAQLQLDIEQETTRVSGTEDRPDFRDTGSDVDCLGDWGCLGDPETPRSSAWGDGNSRSLCATCDKCGRVGPRGERCAGCGNCTDCGS